MEFTISRLPKSLQSTMTALYTPSKCKVFVGEFLTQNEIYCGNCTELIPKIAPNSVAVSIWSPPYFVGKAYERDLDFQHWKDLLKQTIACHFSVLKPGGFLAINIADILCFKDEKMPRIQADVVSGKRVPIKKDDVLKVLAKNPTMSRYELAQYFGCSEQTIDRRLHGNNIRGGKHEPQTRVKIVGGLIEQWALDVGLYPYDRRVWVKDAAWENSKWASTSYKAVDEFEYIYIFWKPGITTYNRARLSKDEWRNWGSRGVWMFPSVRANDDHEAKFPVELPTRLIKMFSDKGDIILDCFMGSGTTAIAAIQQERNYIGIEIDSRYVKLTKTNINNLSKSQ